MIVWRTPDLSLTALLNLSNNISSILLDAEKQKKNRKNVGFLPFLVGFANWSTLNEISWPLASSVGGDSPNGKLQMSFCVLKMSFQSTSVPPASKTNLLAKTQIATPGLCSSVDASQVDFCSWSPSSPVPVHLCPSGTPIIPRSGSSPMLCMVPRAWNAPCSRPSLRWRVFSAVCSHVLHPQTHMTAAYPSDLGKMLVSWTQAWSFVKRH